MCVCEGARRGHSWEQIGNNDANAVVISSTLDKVKESSKSSKQKSESKIKSVTAGKSSCWQEYYDSSAQAKYWFNTVTGEATWVAPS